MNDPNVKKPLGRKAYGSIGHLPNSRTGPGDHSVPEGQARICTEKARDRHDTIIVQEKLDGSCTAVALLNGQLHALGRAGWPAWTSPYEQHHMFAQWVQDNEKRFRCVPREGQLVSYPRFTIAVCRKVSWWICVGMPIPDNSTRWKWTRWSTLKHIVAYEVSMRHMRMDWWYTTEEIFDRQRT